MERLTILRGKGMPALYLWSCKRSYKNGYVWNDLSENGVIYLADGAEYVLKGSEIIPGRTAFSGSVVIDAVRKNGNGEQRDGVKRSTSFDEERMLELQLCVKQRWLSGVVVERRVVG